MPTFVPPPQPQWVPPSPPVARRAPAPVFRGAMPDEAKRVLARPKLALAPLVMPAPEEMGIASRQAADEKADWDTLHHRLDSLGARSIQLDRLPEGGYRFSCLLPTQQPDRCHRVESTADTEVQAVRLVLQQAEQWVAAR
ncbi:MAG TPA: hypothetical protein VFA18_13930 [Gemmataceae bacterium]|nr:hypothetical protein [Gemmataceae bacterium]